MVKLLSFFVKCIFVLSFIMSLFHHVSLCHALANWVTYDKSTCNKNINIIIVRTSAP